MSNMSCLCPLLCRLMCSFVSSYSRCRHDRYVSVLSRRMANLFENAIRKLFKQLLSLFIPFFYNHFYNFYYSGAVGEYFPFYKRPGCADSNRLWVGPVLCGYRLRGRWVAAARLLTHFSSVCCLCGDVKLAYLPYLDRAHLALHFHSSELVWSRGPQVATPTSYQGFVLSWTLNADIHAAVSFARRLIPDNVMACLAYIARAQIPHSHHVAAPGDGASPCPAVMVANHGGQRGLDLRRLLHGGWTNAIDLFRQKV